jgi:hypothetical protein
MFEQTDDDDWRENTSFERKTSELEGRMLGGANWFFWIAALSLVNSIISLYGGGWGFSIGLGFTQLCRKRRSRMDKDSRFFAGHGYCRTFCRVWYFRQKSKYDGFYNRSDSVYSGRGFVFLYRQNWGFLSL